MGLAHRFVILSAAPKGEAEAPSAAMPAEARNTGPSTPLRFAQDDKNRVAENLLQGGIGWQGHVGYVNCP
ncbi:MAG: hypothetical protein JSS95_09715 [Acidobacteria bacterium]|nr:hypothetical protein [Acidobacteriota bacterium]